ncbi:hypothetical protein JOF56_009817 [Kibdelosporangium banguiense]|uniref:Pyridoxamine 5'-phosphate oxidase n=1 Tax=Kibdelosporangium banguiense TaxID=1365924 RepID=A0ABS4TYF3_9PSEU|nr:pyridoxamine 5'-phosphate oxidase family protein [Kibdelosporangium banguiense]MBP2329432.1 hypothetical protein [Kibdelosporangium banguiense]
MVSIEVLPATSATWNDVMETAPAFAADAGPLLEAGSKIVATLRKDGSPRISAIDMRLVEGHAVLMLMPHSQKVRDIRRDPRVAVHASSHASADMASWPGDAKLCGRAVQADPVTAARLRDAIGAPEEVAGDPVFVVDITEVVITRPAPGGDQVEVILWKGGDVRRMQAR